MFLSDKLSEYYGDNVVKKIVDGSTVGRKTSLRINTLKTSIENIHHILSQNEISFSQVNYNKTALIIENNDNAIKDLNIYTEGKIYLQSLSSQLPALILNPQENQDILDMCAAPGGKTTQLAALSNNKSHITACEMNKMRAERLKFNLNKQGVTCANVMVTDARNLESYFSFDKILLDAPCSGSGTFQLNIPKTYSGFTDTLINKCVSAQEKLLDKAMSVLKIGGEIVYSTCSVLPCENEEIIKKVLKKYKCEILPIDQQISSNLPLLPCSIDNAICVCPTREYEGFFVAKMRKTGK